MNFHKTMVIKLLEGKKIRHEVHVFPDTIREATAVADELGVVAAQVFKTLVVHDLATDKHVLVMVPADRQLDLKKLARAVGSKKMKMATHEEAEQLTGLQVGGISALALLNRGFKIFLDASAQQFEQIFVSAGERGLDVKMRVKDLSDLTGARFIDVID